MNQRFQYGLIGLAVVSLIAVAVAVMMKSSNGGLEDWEPPKESSTTVTYTQKDSPVVDEAEEQPEEPVTQTDVEEEAEESSDAESDESRDVEYSPNPWTLNLTLLTSTPGENPQPVSVQQAMLFLYDDPDDRNMTQVPLTQGVMTSVTLERRPQYAAVWAEAPDHVLPFGTVRIQRNTLNEMLVTRLNVSASPKEDQQSGRRGRRARSHEIFVRPRNQTVRFSRLDTIVPETSPADAPTSHLYVAEVNLEARALGSLMINVPEITKARREKLAADDEEAIRISGQRFVLSPDQIERLYLRPTQRSAGMKWNREDESNAFGGSRAGRQNWGAYRNYSDEKTRNIEASLEVDSVVLNKVPPGTYDIRVETQQGMMGQRKNVLVYSDDVSSVSVTLQETTTAIVLVGRAGMNDFSGIGDVEIELKHEDIWSNADRINEMVFERGGSALGTISDGARTITSDYRGIATLGVAEPGFYDITARHPSHGEARDILKVGSNDVTEKTIYLGNGLAEVHLRVSPMDEINTERSAFQIRRASAPSEFRSTRNLKIEDELTTSELPLGDWLITANLYYPIDEYEEEQGNRRSRPSNRIQSQQVLSITNSELYDLEFKIPKRYDITLQFYDDNEPVVGKSVRISTEGSWSSGARLRKITDDKGQVRVKLTDGTYTLRLQAPSRSSQYLDPIKVSKNGPREFLYDIGENVEFKGKFINDETGKIISRNAGLQFRKINPQEGESGRREYRWTQARDGEFEVDGLKRREYEISVYGNDYQPFFQVYDLSDPEVIESRHEIRLKPFDAEGRVEIFLKDEAGIPVRRAYSYRVMNADGRVIFHRTGRSNDDGRLLFRNMVAGSYVAEILPDTNRQAFVPFLSEPFTIHQEERTEKIEITVEEGGRLDLIVLDDNNMPVPGAMTRLLDSDDRYYDTSILEPSEDPGKPTDPSGRVVWRNLPLATFTVEVEKEGYRQANGNVRVRMEKGQTITETIRLRN
jgi:hypothetical protein